MNSRNYFCIGDKVTEIKLDDVDILSSSTTENSSSKLTSQLLL